MDREGHHQETGRCGMRRLKVPVAHPKPRADCGTGWHGEEEQSEECNNAGVLVARRGRLEVLNDSVIGSDRKDEVQNRGPERYPAEQLVNAEWKTTAGAGARPNREHAEDETARDGA
jgi:hypothetical protein